MVTLFCQISGLLALTQQPVERQNIVMTSFYCNCQEPVKRQKIVMTLFVQLIPNNPAKVRSLTRHRSISFDAPIDSIKMVHDVAY